MSDLVLMSLPGDHYGQSLVPKRYKDGQEGKVGGETEAWLRYRYYLHYSEGTLMPFLLISLLMSSMFGRTSGGT